MTVAVQGGRLRFTDLCPSPADFRGELLAGLRQRPRRLPCKYFYDARGARLFEQICEQPEYYPTRAERSVLQAQAPTLAGFCGPRCRLVELGSGSGEKIRVLLDALEEPAAYVPIDISRRQLLSAATTLAEDYPELELLPVCADYAQPLQLPEPESEAARTVVFFPGSTIGNLEPAEARAFLARVARWCRPGDRMLVGADLVKAESVLIPAYNDAAGVTAAFNRNVLVRANAELGATFAVEQFAHEAIYDAERQRIEMRLVSRVEQSVTVGRERFAFAAGEAIVTEHSHKYRPDRFSALAEAAGWETRACFQDARKWFGVFALEWSGEGR